MIYWIGLGGHIGLNKVQCALQMLTLMLHGNTVPLYTSVEGKRDNVVSAGIKNWRIVGNHCFSLCLVPMIQSHIKTSSKKKYILVRWGQATLRSLEDWLHAASHFSKANTPSATREVPRIRKPKVHYFFTTACHVSLTSATFMQSTPFHPLFVGAIVMTKRGGGGS